MLVTLPPINRPPILVTPDSSNPLGPPTKPNLTASGGYKCWAGGRGGFSYIIPPMNQFVPHLGEWLPGRDDPEVRREQPLRRRRRPRHGRQAEVRGKGPPLRLLLRFEGRGRVTPGPACGPSGPQGGRGGVGNLWFPRACFYTSLVLIVFAASSKPHRGGGGDTPGDSSAPPGRAFSPVLSWFREPPVGVEPESLSVLPSIAFGPQPLRPTTFHQRS